MSEPNPFVRATPIEMLAEWEGPAIPGAGIVWDEEQLEKLCAEPNVARLAAWIVATAITEAPGHEARKKKVREVLTTCRQRFGQAKVDEIKQELFRHLEEHRNQRRITDEQFRERIELLFGTL